MRFYTNVQMVGDHFLVRGYDNGEHFMTRERFSPTLFVPSKRETRYQTLNGEYVEPIEPGSVRECRDFIKKYDGVEGLKSTATIVMSINIFLLSILKNRSSLILIKLN